MAPAPDPITRFNDRVEEYLRFRPSYPAALLDCLSTDYGLRPPQVIADVGAGTGILSGLLLARSHRVLAVEPNAAMRAAAEQRLGAHAGFTSIAGTAEATSLPDCAVDWVTAAQAFHWFEPEGARREFVRILRPGGRVALIWNNRRTDTPFLEAYEALLCERANDYAAVRHDAAERDGRIERFFAAGHAFHRFEQVQVLDFTGLAGRTFSASYIPRPDSLAGATLAASLRDLFEAYARDGHVEIAYDTHLYVGRART